MVKTIIVDDNKLAVQALSERLLKYEGIELVGTAYNGLDGLALVNERQPDLLFLDVELPDISGLDFLDRVGAFTHGQCRVVIYTSYDKYVLPAFRKRAFDVLLKPLDEADLATVMSRVEEEPAPVIKDEAHGYAERKHDDKFLFYTNTLDFKLIDKRDVCLFQYDHVCRCWEVVVAGCKSPIRLKRNLRSDLLLGMGGQFVQVNQRFIINMNYLVEVIDNVCHFYPPFDGIDYVKVSRIYRKKLIDKFSSL